ncbi:hypothetical protein HOD20_09320, partial [archaeon]|nr:hypothetical protein [archaeon]
GSTKFKDKFNEINKLFSLQGKIVLSVAFFTHADNDDITAGQKENLDDLHFKKIDLSDSIFVIDINKYISQSTNNEIEYAKSKGKKIIYYSEWIKKNE